MMWCSTPIVLYRRGESMPGCDSLVVRSIHSFFLFHDDGQRMDEEDNNAHFECFFAETMMRYSDERVVYLFILLNKKTIKDGKGLILSLSGEVDGRSTSSSKKKGGGTRLRLPVVFSSSNDDKNTKSI